MVIGHNKKKSRRSIFAFRWNQDIDYENMIAITKIKQNNIAGWNKRENFTWQTKKQFIELGAMMMKRVIASLVSSFMRHHTHNQAKSISSSAYCEKQIIPFFPLLFLCVVKSWLISTQFGKVLFAHLIRNVWLLCIVRRLFIANRHKQQQTTDAQCEKQKQKQKIGRHDSIVLEDAF